MINSKNIYAMLKDKNYIRNYIETLKLFMQ